jgi:hypothetical protein
MNNSWLIRGNSCLYLIREGYYGFGSCTQNVYKFR